MGLTTALQTSKECPAWQAEPVETPLLPRDVLELHQQNSADVGHAPTDAESGP